MQHTVEFGLPRGAQDSFEISDQDGRDFVVRQVLNDGLQAYEAPLPSLLIAYLSDRRGTFVDVGANTGLYSLLAAAISSDIDVIAFEPLPDIHSKLAANIALNPALAANIRCSNVALSDRSGTAMFFETINDMGFLTTSSSLEEAHARMIGGRYASTEVRTETLDGWIESNRIQKVLVIKVDVEGHEHDVLKGARHFFAEHRPLAVVELLGGSDFEYFRQFVVANNYVNFELEPQHLRLAPEIQFNGRSWNHVFCPFEKVHSLVAAAHPAGLALA